MPYTLCPITSLASVVRTANGILRVGNMGMHRTFEVVVVGEELTTSAGDLVHHFCLAYSISDCRPKTPKEQNR